MTAADPRLAACAAGEAAWQAIAYAGLGAPWTVGAGIAYGSPPHRFLLGAVTLTPRPRLPPKLSGEVRDSFASLTMGELPGWTYAPADPWMYRDPAQLPDVHIAGIEIERTDDALLFERTAFLAASGSAPDAPGELHPAGSHNQSGLRLFLARRSDGVPIGSALAVLGPHGVAVSAVGVIAAERRRGIGAALTVAALRAAPDQPAVLCSSELGQPVYEALGFDVVGRGFDWQPPPTP